MRSILWRQNSQLDCISHLSWLSSGHHQRTPFTFSILIQPRPRKIIVVAVSTFFFSPFSYYRFLHVNRAILLLYHFYSLSHSRRRTKKGLTNNVPFFHGCHVSIKKIKRKNIISRFQGLCKIKKYDTYIVPKKCSKNIQVALVASDSKLLHPTLHRSTHNTKDMHTHTPKTFLAESYAFSMKSPYFLTLFLQKRKMPSSRCT